VAKVVIQSRSSSEGGTSIGVSLGPSRCRLIVVEDIESPLFGLGATLCVHCTYLDTGFGMIESDILETLTLTN
jgi:hypothetical protein